MSQGQENEPDSTSADRADVEALYLRHSEEILRFLVGVLKDRWAAEDVLQATFAKAVSTAGKLDPVNGRAWLFKVSFHEAMDWRRKRLAERTGNEKIARSRTGFSRFDDLLENREVLTALSQELEKLPQGQSQVVRMRIYDELTFAEIAEKLDLPLGTVLTRMRTALEKLRGRLTRE